MRVNGHRMLYRNVTHANGSHSTNGSVGQVSSLRLEDLDGLRLTRRIAVRPRPIRLHIDEPLFDNFGLLPELTPLLAHVVQRKVEVGWNEAVRILQRRKRIEQPLDRPAEVTPKTL